MEETETTQEIRKRRALTQSQYYQLCKWVEGQAIGVFATISEAANVGSTVLGVEVPESTLQSAIADTKRAIVEVKEVQLEITTEHLTAALKLLVERVDALEERVNRQCFHLEKVEHGFIGDIATLKNLQGSNTEACNTRLTGLESIQGPSPESLNTRFVNIERHQDSMLEMIKSLSSVVESGMKPSN